MQIFSYLMNLKIFCRFSWYSNSSLMTDRDRSWFVVAVLLKRVCMHSYNMYSIGFTKKSSLDVLCHFCDKCFSTFSRCVLLLLFAWIFASDLCRCAKYHYLYLFMHFIYIQMIMNFLLMLQLWSFHMFFYRICTKCISGVFHVW